MRSDSRDLRGHADSLRRAADRLTLLRLRLANTISEVSRSEDPTARRIGEQIHERWNAREYAELGRVVTGLRTSAGRLEEIATTQERSSGRRLGGYTGAGFLGRGDDAHLHVGEVARHVGEGAGFDGGQHGASIGGFPLVPQADETFLPHPSHTLGTDTPDYDEDA